MCLRFRSVTSSLPDIWTKNGDDLFALNNSVKTEIAKYNVGDDLDAGTNHVFSGFNWKDIFATDDFLWGLRNNNTIYQLSKVDVSILDTIPIVFPSADTATNIWVIDDIAAYILSTTKIYHMNFSTGEVTFISDIGNAADGTLHFRNGYFYIFFNGGGFTGVSKWGPLFCPGTAELIS